MANNKKITTYATAMRNLEKQDKYLKLAALIGFFILWEFLGWLNLHTDFVNIKHLPIPSEIFRSASSLWRDGLLQKHLIVSLRRASTGYIIGVLASIFLGAMIASIRLVDNVVSPIITLLGPIPVMAFLPMFILWFGMGEGSKVTLIAYSTTLGMISYVVLGIKDTDSTLIRSALSLGASELQVFWHVKFQSALPYIFEGLKGALGVAFTALTVAEMLGATRGLGFLIVFSKNWFRINDMVMTAILIGLVYYVFSSILSVFEKIVCGWKYKAIGHAVE